jgi:hypothetical protein
MEPEKSRTKTGQSQLSSRLRRIGVYLGKQSNQELVVPLGPGHPETHATEPEQNPLHVQLFDGLLTGARNIREDKPTYHYSEEVVPEATFVNMVSPRLTVLVERGLE